MSAADRLRAIAAQLIAEAELLERQDVDPEQDGAADLIESWQAERRFEIPQDTLRKWCREDACGVKRGGRWLVSVSRVRARLGQ
jgi:hypothetical protein